MVSHKVTDLVDLPPGAVVGTSSLRRAAQILALRPDLQIKDIRGNVDTRLRKVEDQSYGYDATLLALAGLQRLGHADLPQVHPIAHDVVLPAPGQGALAVQGRRNDPQTTEYLAVLDHAPTRAAVTAERAFLAGLGGGCSLPVAALGQAKNHHLEVQALVAHPDGQHIVYVNSSGSSDLTEAAALGAQLARQALTQGATALLAGG